MLPRIERRGSGGSNNNNDDRSAGSLEITNSSSLAMAISPQNREIPVMRLELSRAPLSDNDDGRSGLGGLETSPTTRSTEFIGATNGPPAKAAWCTPRSPLGSHLEEFFATAHAEAEQEDANERRRIGDTDAVLATPARLQSVEDSLRETDERYRIDLDKLIADNDKFFEVSSTATQHLEDIQSELPRLTNAFTETTYVSYSLGVDSSGH